MLPGPTFTNVSWAVEFANVCPTSNPKHITRARVPNLKRRCIKPRLYEVRTSHSTSTRGLSQLLKRGVTADDRSNSYAVMPGGVRLWQSWFAVRKQRDQQRIRQAAMRTNSVAKLFCASTYIRKLRPHRS